MAIAYVRYRRWIYLGDKEMPDCSCGSSDFRYHNVGADYYLLCQKCNTRYEKRRDSVWVFEGGERKPYKQLVRHRGWV